MDDASITPPPSLTVYHPFEQESGGIFPQVRPPGMVPILGASVVLIVSAVAASMMPAARASKVDAMQALRAD